MIDDDRDDAEIFKEALEEISPAIVFYHYNDAKVALEELSVKKVSLPDLIFLDINMPVLSGWECLNQFKQTEHLADIPVIMYTTSSLEKEKEIAHKSGASGFIAKPNDYKELKKVLAATIRSKLEQ